jgi:hypothetical protein
LKSGKSYLPYDEYQKLEEVVERKIQNGAN